MQGGVELVPIYGALVYADETVNLMYGHSNDYENTKELGSMWEPHFARL
jgi:hypothetical protein